MPLKAVEVRGLKEFRAALKELDGGWTKELALIHRDIADKSAGWARSAAAGGSPMQRAAAGAITGRGTASVASIEVAAGADAPFANVAFWGEKRHTGWYADPRYHDSPPQGPRWVGTGWDVAVAGQGPYVINDQLAQHLDELVERVGDNVTDLARAAFPD